ncbi:hypothetical protein niasHS_011608 [Heterodera schachtii]|uniref:Uncharacterized protein n=1 Tax=Heterodera schachtii TaxID=97005 RepID=A0ABD2IKN2_HETSC
MDNSKKWPATHFATTPVNFGETRPESTTSTEQTNANNSNNFIFISFINQTILALVWKHEGHCNVMEDDNRLQLLNNASENESYGYLPEEEREKMAQEIQLAPIQRKIRYKAKKCPSESKCPTVAEHNVHQPQQQNGQKCAADLTTMSKLLPQQQPQSSFSDALFNN